MFHANVRENEPRLQGPPTSSRGVDDGLSHVTHSPPITRPPEDTIRGGFSGYSPSTSPQATYSRPVRPVGGFQNHRDHIPTSPRGRPASMSHFPQLYPYGARDADAGSFQSRSTSRKSVTGEFHAFDSLACSGDDASLSAENVLLVAGQNSLHVYQIEREKLQAFGRLEGLRGRVITAKVLPCPFTRDQLRHVRPLVAIVIHGPTANHASTASRPGTSHSQQFEHDPSVSATQGIPPVQPYWQSTSRYQTTVEIYSLKDGKHVCTLFQCDEVEAEPITGERIFEPPAPVGSLRIYAKGRFVIVASGVSGEVHIFEATNGIPELPFQCIGKIWTSLPVQKGRSWSSASTPSEVDAIRDSLSTNTINTDTALLSLSNRWLAFVPPVPSMRPKLAGGTDLIRSSKGPPGLKSHTPSLQPQVTCELDTPLEESMINKVARDVTQEVLKGARWVGDQGMQAWKNYWHKSPDQISAHEQRQSSPPSQAFPPTHAKDDPNRIVQPPTIISVLDLERLSESQDTKTDVALHPIATFLLPGGCSYLSFHPSGLALFTASSKGDVQYVWDLMRMVHGKINILPSAGSSSSEESPNVRQIARFTRVTTANIVDVVWAEPRGEKLAMVTERGTVHVHDLPLSALRWPPPLRAPRPSVKERTTSFEVNQKYANGMGWGATINAVSETAQPWFTAVRGNPLAGLGGFNITSAGAGAGVKGGKIVASGFSKSVGAAAGTVNTIRHMGENRLHIPGSSQAIASGCIQWITSKGRNSIAVVGGGILIIHAVLQNNDAKSSKRRQSVVGERLAEFGLPSPSAKPSTAAPEVTNISEDFNDSIVLAGRQRRHSNLQKQHRNTGHPLSYAEIETSSPYQPFHTDTHVSLRVYSGTDLHYNDSSPWVFGDDVPATRVTSGLDNSDEPDLGSRVPGSVHDLDQGHANEDVEDAQVIVTTRRRRGKKQASIHTEKDDGFDDYSFLDHATDRV